VYWYLSLPADELPAAARAAASIRDRYVRQFHAPFRAIVMATRDEDMRVEELFDREPIAAWGRGRLTLLGDAAHPMLAHAGQGAAQAIEDAVALGRVLQDTTDVVAALRRYEALRSARTRTIVRLARRNARMGSIGHPIGRWWRDTLIRMVPERFILRPLVAIARSRDDSW
jgi:2-polyprenyl-6-methoxyphenol hydroxylase-like FAD-dependent oxidoreductase